MGRKIKEAAIRVLFGGLYYAGLAIVMVFCFLDELFVVIHGWLVNQGSDADD